MTPVRYRIVNAQAETEQFRTIFREAKANGEADLVLAAMKRIFHRLSLVPLDIGEGREELASLEISMRIDFEGPLAISYGVHEAARTVFIRYIRYSHRRAE